MLALLVIALLVLVPLWLSEQLRNHSPARPMFEGWARDSDGLWRKMAVVPNSTPLGYSRHGYKRHNTR